MKFSHFYFVTYKFLVLFLITAFFDVHSQENLRNIKFVELVDYLPNDFVKDGTVDYTVFLQQGLDENNNVIFPNFPILINENGLNAKCNQILNFPPNSKLIIKPNSEVRYGILNIKYVNNVVVNNPTLIGDKEKHLSEKGEWGMGINIWASKNVKINNPNISKTWGDGIYVGEPSLKERQQKGLSSYTNYNITVKGGVIDDCLRNGISIVSGVDVLIDGTTIQNMNTKAPKSAIDIEPNGTYNEIRNVVLKNIVTKNNFNGIIVFLVNLAQEKQYHVGKISIENHQDYSSKSALVIRNYHKRYDNKNFHGVAGKIKIKNAS